MKPIAQHLLEAEREYLKELMASCQGCVAKAAVIAGIDRTSLYRRMHRHDLVKPPKRGIAVRTSWRMVDLHAS